MGTGHDPLHAGISRKRIDQMGVLAAADWHRANDRREIVGSCRQPQCGGLMQPTETHTEGKVTWYAAVCLNCGHEVTAPDGRVLARSSRHEEMPPGWWPQRVEVLKRRAATGSSEAA